MNGARTTFMRRGYLLTALSALLLLAASPGTVAAQTGTGITVTGPTNGMVNEGGTATYTVTVRGYVGTATDIDDSGVIETDEAINPTAFTLTLPTPTPGTTAATAGEADDLNTNLHVLSATFDPPSNSSTTSRLLFTQSKTISVVTLHDNDAEDEEFTLAFPAVTGLANFFVAATGDGSDPTVSLAASTDARNTPPNSLTIKDDETQTYKLTLAPVHLTPGQTPKEGTSFVVNLTADPAHQDGSGMLQVNLDKGSAPWVSGPWTLGIGDSDADSPGANPAVVVAPGTGGTPAADSTVELTITQTLGDGNRVTDTVTVSAHMGVAGASRQVDSLSIDVADINALQAVTAKVVDKDGVVLKEQPASVEEGMSVKIAVMPVDKDGKATPANEALDIALMSSGTANSQDFRLSAPIKIASGHDKSNVVDLIVESDEDVGLETLVLDATVSGVPANGAETSTSAGVLSLSIEDATARKIWTKEQADADPMITAAIEAGAGDEGLNPGESFEINTSDLFGYAEGYSVSFSAASDSEAVRVGASGKTVTVDAVSAGDATVTITGTATMPSSSFDVAQTVSNVASLSFPVAVVLEALSVAVAADDAEVEEGGSTMITATASREVAASDGDVTVNLTATSGGELSADSITIEAGSDSGYVTLTAAQDDDYADGSITVVASGAGIDGNVSISVAVTDDDEAPVEPEPTNAIEAKPEDEAYPIITDAIDAGAGEEGLNPGESATIDAAELFTVMEGYTASYAADVDGDAASASVSGSHVTIMADALGEAKVTITGTATAASSSFQAGQPAANVATVTFAVMVVDKGLTIELHGPDNVMEGNLVEGSEYHLTVKANRVVREDTMVSFAQRGGAENAASAADYELNDVTLLAGSDSVRATLSIVEDMEADAGHAMGEQLIIYAMAGDAESDDLMFTIWDEAVPALPLIAQLLLALFLMAGGARLYRRRQG